MKWIVQNLQLLLTGFAIIASAGYLATGLTRKQDDGIAIKPGHVKKSLIVLAATIALGAATGFVPAGYRGVVFNASGGVDMQERSEGVNFMVPFVQRLHNLDVRTQVYELESFAQTQDLQEVTLPVAVNYSVEPTLAAELYQQVGYGYVQSIVAPAVQQAITQVAGQINAKDIARSRGPLAESIQVILMERLGGYGVTVEFVSVKDAVFDPAFIAQIKANVVALEREVESERLVTVAQNEALALVATAEGAAQAERLRGSGVADANSAIQQSLTQDIIDWQVASTWDGAVPSVVLGEGTTPIVTLP